MRAVSGVEGLPPAEPLRAYLSEILAWNARVGLVSRQQTAGVLIRLVRQSAEMWHHLRHTGDASRAADIGSGAGFPGVICKLVSPALTLLLIERRERKATFLERVSRVLGFEGLTVTTDEAEVAAGHPAFAGTFDIVMASAVAGPAELAEPAGQLLRPGGRFATLRPREEAAPPVRAGQLHLDTRECLTDALLVVYSRPA